MDISTSCITTASGTPRARAHLAYGVASSLESQRHQFEYLSDQRCCQAGLQGVDVSWSGWKRRGSEQVSGDRRGSSGDGPGGGATARRANRMFSATA